MLWHPRGKTTCWGTSSFTSHTVTRASGGEATQSTYKRSQIWDLILQPKGSWIGRNKRGSMEKAALSMSEGEMLLVQYQGPRCSREVENIKGREPKNQDGIILLLFYYFFFS